MAVNCAGGGREGGGQGSMKVELYDVGRRSTVAGARVVARVVAVKVLRAFAGRDVGHAAVDEPVVKHDSVS